MKYLIRNIIWCIIILVLCAIPGDTIPSTSINVPYFDKIVHFGMFFMMGVFLCAELRYQTSLSYTKTTILTVILVAIYGGIIEVLQHYIFIKRSGDYYDLIADILGGLVATFIFPWLKKKKDIIIEKPLLRRFTFLKKII